MPTPDRIHPADAAPAGWATIATRKVGPFVTARTFRLPDGSERTWTSRRHRKRLGLQALRLGEGPRRRLAPVWSPARITWWIGVLFMIGAALFALGSFPPYGDAVSARTDAITYFVGSIFFTSAGYLQFLEAVNAGRAPNDPRAETFRFVSWDPGRIDWWASGVQSIGTLLFNVSTFAAIDATLTTTQTERVVWAPDMFGSICFMIASTLAWLEVCGGWWRLDLRDVSWWIVALNLLGSIAFQISAIAAYIDPQDGEMLNLPIANLGTFVGAVCFLAGAYLLLPEMGADGTPAADQTSV